MTERMLCTFERKVLRIIHDPIQNKGRRRLRWNSEHYNVYKDLNVIVGIKIGRQGWVGHSTRMEDGRI